MRQPVTMPAEDSGSPQGPNFHEEGDVRPASEDGCRPDQSRTLGSEGSIQPGVTDKSIGGDNISCGSECDTVSPNTGSNYHGPVAREQQILDDLSVLPYAAADFTDTTPAASRYSLRNRSCRKQPLHLMFTTTRDEELNNLGGTVSKESLCLAKTLWMWCLERNIHSTARCSECVSRCRVSDHERLLRLAAESSHNTVNLFGPKEMDMLPHVRQLCT